MTALLPRPRQSGAWVPALLLLAMALATASRPLTPLDETRYAAVAWEMWSHGDWLVPHLEGQPYAHKPPLLFWLIHAGWAVFGVHAWWPLLLSPLFAAATLALLPKTAELLWPGRELPARAAPCVLLACGLYTVLVNVVLFDVMLAFFAVLAWHGWLRAWRDGAGVGGPARGMAIAALGLAGALLSKGPAALLHVLPPALLAPWWMLEARPRGWRRWYTAVGLVTLAGAVPVLAWAIPAALVGGADYRNAIFWGQTAGRMHDSFAHAGPWYSYLAALPLVLAPWFLWPRWWAGLRRAGWGDAGVRFATIGSVAALLAFSAVSGKRLHYLLPEFALFALLVARGVDATAAASAAPPRRGSLALPVLTLALAGAAVASAPSWSRPLAQMLAQAPAGSAAALRGAGFFALVAAALLAWRRPRGDAGDVRAVAAASVASLMALALALWPALREPQDVNAVGQRLGEHQRAGRPLAVDGEHHGQWTFAGRLERPLEAVPLGTGAAWLAAHPQGRLVYIQEGGRPLPQGLPVEYAQRYRGSRVAILAPASAAVPPGDASQAAAPPSSATGPALQPVADRRPAPAH